MTPRWLGRLIVTAVTGLISFIGFSSQIFVIWPYYGSALSIELLVLLIPFNALLFMLFWNYRLCVVTPAGSVPVEWCPDVQAAEGYEVKKLTGGPRFCRTCQTYKPPRTHHCRSCGKCVLRMDHHCPWINNCVGHFTYGHFLRFLFYVDVACAYHLSMITWRVFHAMHASYWEQPESTEMIFIILNYCTSVPVFLCVGGFSIYHFFALKGNSTTIEGWEKDKVATLVRRGRIQDVKFPYNLGARRNIDSVLGTNPLFWCWPAVAPGTGLKFELVEGDVADEAQQTWPPRDPETIRSTPFVLPESPWTYERDGPNPALRASNTQLRALPKKKRRSEQQQSSLPPYHPDYHASVEDRYAPPSSASSSSSSAYNISPPRGQVHAKAGDATDYELDDEDDDDDVPLRRRLPIRRGSEGYEVGTVDREAMLESYVQSLGEEAGRYRRYVPEPSSETESEEEEEEEEGKDAVEDSKESKIRKWAQGTAKELRKRV